MSRARRFTHSLATGYLLLGVTTFQTLAAVPLALRYLSKEEFGLWALVAQIAGYLLLIDLGMSGAISRILIDHKDDPRGGAYGAVIKTGALVLAAQGAMIAIGGTLLSFILPGLMAVPANHRHDFQLLVAGQCCVLGVLFVGRLFNNLLQAHQRYDACNYASMAGIAANLGAMWFGFEQHWGLYSLLAASVAGQVVSTLFALASAWKLKLLPDRGNRTKPDAKTFREIFAYGREVFLIFVGLQLVSASQIIVISRTLGLDAAAVWSIATKLFMLAQQVVYRPLDFSAAALSEMMVRKERENLRLRFRDIVILSASLAVWAGLAAAICNSSFLALWTRGRIQWPASSDWLMALLLIVNATTRCYVGFTGYTKDIRAMKYVYLIEGVAFVGLSFAVAPYWGMNGVIVSAIVTNLLCTGVYGFRRTREYFGLGNTGALLAWLRPSLLCLVAQALLFAASWQLASHWHSLARLCFCGAVAGTAGAALFWQLGLSPHLRLKASELILQLRGPRKPS